MMTMKNQS
ncbi:hypothetical protein Pint_00735 [Pistacia integerrima]|uniref:Uncharacterized protein n=1 Tax=Pistacia integerrima TaxID=434235 RepID=A0ACC0ZM62_9ROSI|nr:hypothetical protein Pint_00735 [Pistacia integerrima]